ncbi:AraC family transcriptional regulator [Acetatifactor muris]|uniref:Regulatory protein PchR n=1 Tax=Acetatifactor muris TaxID=879566 RepID=A0A2K4ZMP2_9FIRM|nr:AraC family transcriptional regulator [Acetatifactor muris]MCR2049964.1 AraC family transcriptional regulator [Acetatifactor muris]SOY31686.1 Regulatory protein PchR [Acetatifactor muris]
MKTLYTDLDIRFTLDGISVRALNIVFERFTQTLPSHSHGSGCYEIHYIPFGYGKLNADGQYYDIVPNTLYVTGPHIVHAQTPILDDPMQEYCVYLKIRDTFRSRKPSPVMDAFLSMPFWIGLDTQGVHPLMRQLFSELEHRYTGYQNQVELLLPQLLICMVRNYEQHRLSSTVFAHNMSDSKSVIIDQYFLYEYHSLSLEVLADRLKVSPRQTQRLLQEYYGKTFQQKKAEARMSAAAILLSDRERSISSIAEALGYSSAEHFSSAFRNYYKISPGRYRRQNVL